MCYNYNGDSMIENVTEEKLQEILKNIVLPGSSIGVHGIARDNPAQIADLIMKQGLLNSRYHSGLTGTIAFLGQVENIDCKDILSYTYGIYDDEGNVYTIVCAIPEVVKDETGKEYYLGVYNKSEKHGKDDLKLHSNPTHDLGILFPEYIVGCVVRNVHTRQSKFILNGHYISFQSEKDQALINIVLLSFIRDYNSHVSVYALDEDDYERVSHMLSKIHREDLDYYRRSFVEKYESLYKGECK